MGFGGVYIYIWVESTMIKEYEGTQGTIWAIIQLL